MAKNDKAGEAPTPAPAADPLDARLAPIDEFRERADSWMKEITAQVAKLAGRSEEEDRRKKAMDERLSDIENRMQSLLTLTEMVSLSKNPFAGPTRQQPAPQGSSPAAPTPQDPAPAEPAVTTEGQTNPEPEAPAPAAAAASNPPDAEETAPPRPEAEPERRDATPAAPPQPPTRPTAVPTRTTHPNDAQAEPAPVPADPERLPVAATFPRTATTRKGAAPSTCGSDMRYFVLEWARLLAPSAGRIDLSAFLGFYVESGWIDAGTTAAVRNLTLQLMKEDAPEEQAMGLEELHARSILLVSRLEGDTRRPDEARTVLHDAREAARGDWAILQR